MVFFGVPRVFLVFFAHDLEKTKKTQVFFGFLKELLLEVRQKTKKTQVFFGFLHGLLLDVFFISVQKPKKLEENQKKTNMSLRPNIL